MNLDLVVLKSDESKTMPLALSMINDFVAIGVEHEVPPMPVVPIARVLSKSFKIVTVPQRVRAVVSKADQLGLVFEQGCGIVSEKVLTLFSAKEWISQISLIQSKYVGYWLLWGVNWMVLDRDDLAQVFKDDGVYRMQYEEAARIEAARLIDALKN